MNNNQEDQQYVNSGNTGANYVESGSTPRHVDTSTLDPKKPSPVRMVILGAILLVFAIWAFLVYTDFGNIKRNEEPQFCFFGTTEQEIKEGDFVKGKINECIGLGYKVVKYETLDARMTEFVPLWEKTKTLDVLEEK